MTHEIHGIPETRGTQEAHEKAGIEIEVNLVRVELYPVGFTIFQCCSIFSWVCGLYLNIFSLIPSEASLPIEVFGNFLAFSELLKGVLMY